MSESGNNLGSTFDPEMVCVAYALRVAAWSYRDIGETLGVDPHTAYAMVSEACRNKPANFSARSQEILRQYKRPERKLRRIIRKPLKRIESKRLAPLNRHSPKE